MKTRVVIYVPFFSFSCVSSGDSRGKKEELARALLKTDAMVSVTLFECPTTRFRARNKGEHSMWKTPALRNRCISLRCSTTTGVYITGFLLQVTVNFAGTYVTFVGVLPYCAVRSVFLDGDGAPWNPQTPRGPPWLPPKQQKIQNTQHSTQTQSTRSAWSLSSYFPFFLVAAADTVMLSVFFYCRRRGGSRNKQRGGGCGGVWGA